MAVKEFTCEQQKAINSKCPILVSAAAGSGKTAVLTERVISKLTDPINPISADKLLIVTFTNAAAFEMKSRIEKRLFEESAKNPTSVNLIKQKHKIANADICTIDSFCINLVRENFEKCGVEPNFKVSDGNEMKQEMDSILTEIIDCELENGKENLDLLFELLGCEYDDSELKSLINNIYLHSRQLPFPDRFFNNLILPYKHNFSKTHPWYIEANRIAKDYLEIMSDCIEDMADCALKMVSNAEECDNYVKNLSYSLDELKEIFINSDWDEFKAHLYEFVLGRIAIKSVNGVVGEEFKAYRKNFSDALTKLKSLYSQGVKEIETSNERILPAVQLLVKLVKKYDEESLKAYKKENKLSFFHTEQMALEVLCYLDESENVIIREDAKSYLSKYEEVMVDEFQDVNDLQNLLFEILSNNNEKLFVVGDIKQSIYRFRGSDLHNFLQKKKTYKPFDCATENDAKKIILADNFRSRKGVCDFVNYLFSLIMTEKTGEIEYVGEESLKPSAKYPESDEPQTELLVVNKGEADDESLYEYESLAIAEYIKDLVERKFKVSDDGETLRNVTYGDICILMEKPTKKAPILAKILAENGIPISFSNESYCQTAEISLALSLLSVLDNPARDVELLCVMMSPIYGFSTDELANMRANLKKGNIYATVLFAAQNGDKKAKDFLNSLEKLRLDMAILPLDKFIHKIIYDTGLVAFVSAMPNGKQRRKNLLALPNFAEDLNDLSATDFVDYMNSLPENSFRANNISKEFVSIMSMHKSKGLQFPVCILSDLSSKINNEDSISRVVYNDKMGIGFKYFDESEKLTTENLGRKVISKKTARENNEEEMRLLYVALTRAKEKLVLVSALKDTEKTVERISQNLKSGEIDHRFVNSVNSLGDLVLAGCLLHPDCELLRQQADVSIAPIKTDSKISVKIADCKRRKIVEKEDDIFEANEDLVNKIKSNTEYVYPFEELSEIESKTSVSAVAKGNESRKYYFSDRPQFMNERGMTSAQKGTAMHNIMQFINFSENVNVDGEIERLVEWQFITEEQGETADRQKLIKFFKSNLFSRILGAVDVKREMRFLTELPAKRIDERVSDKFENEKIIVQGAVDLLFDEGDGLVIVDFKTDRVESADTLIGLYSEQLNIYANACEKIFGKRVKEKIIYSFHLGESIPLLS